MKRNILHTLWAAAVVLLTACQQEELPLPGADNAAPLAITVTDGGYAPTASPGDMQKTLTRATESGYSTKFTAGDECGLYIVRGGTVVYDNVKLTAAGSDGNLTWQPEADITGGLENEQYFLYYPYQETAKMAGKVNATATTSDGDFFATLINKWQPGDDQSDYAAYTAGDLMTATGTAVRNGNIRQLTFAMTHRMALAVIEMPKTVYRFTNTPDGAIPDYTVSTAADFTPEAKPCRNSDGTYRYLVNPSHTAPSLTGSYDGGKKEFTLTPNGIAASNYKTYKVNGAQTVEKEYTLQMGDYLLADGNLVGKNDLTEEQQASVIAIVFYAGRHEKDNSDYTEPLTDGGPKLADGKVHGYAVALTDATSGYCMWGVYGTELGLYPKNTGGSALNNYSNPSIDWSGYSYTRTIITTAGGKEKLNATEDAGYPATYYAVVDYENKVKAPANSSGWFLPSIGQMWNVYQQRSLLTSAGGSNLRSDDYWSSSEDYRYPARYALFVDVRSDYVYYYGKDLRVCYVRAVLAF